MTRRLIIILILPVFIWNFAINVPGASAVATVFDVPTEIATGISAGANTAEVVREYILKPIVRILARTMLNNLTAGIISKIQNGGRDGGPAFVQNWGNFLTNSQYRGEDVFRSVLASTTLCSYLSSDIKGLFGARDSLPPPIGQNLRVDSFDSFRLRANCTLPSGFNMTSYQQDFSGNGGWSAWSRLLEPQNNYYGLLLQSFDEATRQRSLAQNGDINEALAGNGYTSIRGACQDTQLVSGEQGPTQPRCAFLGKVFTPGDLLGKSAASTIDNELGWITSSTDLASIVINVLGAVINRLGNLALADTAGDYANAPRATDTTESNTYLDCINSCPSGTDTSCQMQCAHNMGYNAPSSSCEIDITTSVTTCTESTPICMDSSTLNILKNEKVMMPGTKGIRFPFSFKDAVTEWSKDYWTRNNLRPNIITNTWVGISREATELPLDHARLNIANDSAQLINDGKLKLLKDKLNALAQFVTSSQNDGLLTYNTQRDIMLNKVLSDYDALVNEPDCATLPPPTTTTIVPPEDGGDGGGSVPNRSDVVEAINDANPGLIQNSMEFTDTVCRALAQEDSNWGRKARQRDNPSSRNGDALAYRLDPSDTSKKALVDIVQSSDSPSARPGWIVYPGPNPGNGYWIPCP